MAGLLSTKSQPAPAGAPTADRARACRDLPVRFPDIIAVRPFPFYRRRHAAAKPFPSAPLFFVASDSRAVWSRNEIDSTLFGAIRQLGARSPAGGRRTGAVLHGQQHAAHPYRKG